MANKSFAKVLVRRATGRQIDELLRELYVGKRHSQDEIAAALTKAIDDPDVRLSRTTIGDWLAEYGITRDDRSAVEISGSPA